VSFQEGICNEQLTNRTDIFSLEGIGICCPDGESVRNGGQDLNAHVISIRRTLLPMPSLCYWMSLLRIVDSRFPNHVYIKISPTNPEGTYTRMDIKFLSLLKLP
jgi:hypothetical protein